MSVVIILFEECQPRDFPPSRSIELMRVSQYVLNVHDYTIAKLYSAHSPKSLRYIPIHFWWLTALDLKTSLSKIFFRGAPVARLSVNDMIFIYLGYLPSLTGYSLFILPRSTEFLISLATFELRSTAKAKLERIRCQHIPLVLVILWSFIIIMCFCITLYFHCHHSTRLYGQPLGCGTQVIQKERLN